jgi:hypothetical protein
MACSVKFFEPITMVSLRGGPQEMAAMTKRIRTAAHRVRFFVSILMARPRFGRTA